jgi:heme exporter protein D
VLSYFFDVVNKIVSWFYVHESWELDDLTAVSVFLVIALVVYAWRRRNEVLEEVRRREEAEEERNELLPKLEEMRADAQRLKKLLPICGGCGKVRDDKGYWNEVELYVQAHFDMKLSYGVCPECARRLYRNRGR